MARPEVKIRLADGLDLDTDGLLIGRVDKVQASVGGGDSAIGMTFNKARMKGGREIAIKATILWIGESTNLLNPTVVSAPADRTTPGVGVLAGSSQLPDAGVSGFGDRRFAVSNEQRAEKRECSAVASGSIHAEERGSGCELLQRCWSRGFRVAPVARKECVCSEWDRVCVCDCRSGGCPCEAINSLVQGAVPASIDRAILLGRDSCRLGVAIGVDPSPCG